MYQILRYPLSTGRRDKEVYDEFSCQESEARTVARSLRNADSAHWYWHAKAPKVPVSTKSPEPAQNPIIPAITELLAA